MAAPKLMLFELDGATWTVMKPLIEKGELPNLKSLMDRGAHGVLMSESPSISPKIWTTIFSGKTPEKHGIDFFGASSKMLRSKRIWDILGGLGYKVGTFGTLVTWPPYPLNGFMIPSICALGTETYPEEYRFFQEIALSERKKFKNTAGPILALKDSVNMVFKLLSHGVGLGSLMSAAGYVAKEKLLRYGLLDSYWRKVFLHLRLGTEFLTFLMNRFQPDFCTWHIHTCDSLAHRYWAFYEPEPFEGKVAPRLVARHGHVIPDSYRESDAAIGRILKRLGPDTNVVVCSDHGGRALPEAINPYTADLDKLLDFMGMAGKVVVARFGPGVYLHFREKDKDLLEKAHKILSAAFIQHTGDKIFLTKPFKNTLVVTKPNWRIQVDQIKDESVIDFGELGTRKIKDLFSKQIMQMSGTHDDAGIIIMAGPGIKKGVELPEYSVYDMTPTMLTILGEALGRDMDGKVIEQAFEPDFLEKKGGRFIDTYEDGEYADTEDEEIDHDKLKERLQHLGYL